LSHQTKVERSSFMVAKHLNDKKKE